MPPALRMEGAAQLADLAADLKRMDNRELRKEMLAGIRKVTKPAVAAVRVSAELRLPRRGGLAHAVASGKVAARTSTSPRSAGVRISRPIGAGLDRSGRFRHPVFGNRDVWVAQEVDPGWFTDPLEALEPTVQAAMKRVLNDIARKIETGGSRG